MIEVEYTGDDVIIPRETIEQLGLTPGTRLQIRPAPKLEPISRSTEEKEAILAAWAAFRDAFDPIDLDDWETAREELWRSTPHPPTPRMRPSAPAI